MKKIFTILFTGILLGGITAQTVISQNDDPTLVDVGGVACWSNETGEYRDNYFARTYDLSGDFGIDSDFTVSEIQFGVGSADPGREVEITIFTASSEDLSNDFTTFNELATVTVTATETEEPLLQTVTLDEPVVIPAGSIAVMQVYAWDTGEALVRYFPGLNSSGNNSIGWIKSEPCSIVNWTDSSTLAPGQIEMQAYVYNLVGNTMAVNDVDGLSLNSSLYPNPVKDVLNIRIPASNTLNSVNVFNTLGQQMKVQLTNGQLNMSSLPKGIYMVELNTEKGTIVRKVIKK